MKAPFFYRRPGKLRPGHRFPCPFGDCGGALCGAPHRLEAPETSRTVSGLYDAGAFRASLGSGLVPLAWRASADVFSP